MRCTSVMTDFQLSGPYWAWWAANILWNFFNKLYFVNIYYKSMSQTSSVYHFSMYLTPYRFIDNINNVLPELESASPHCSPEWRRGVSLPDLQSPPQLSPCEADRVPGHRGHRRRQGEGLQGQHWRGYCLSHQRYHPPSCLYILVGQYYIKRSAFKGLTGLTRNPKATLVQLLNPWMWI